MSVSTSRSHVGAGLLLSEPRQARRHASLASSLSGGQSSRSSQYLALFFVALVATATTSTYFSISEVSKRPVLRASDIAHREDALRYTFKLRNNASIALPVDVYALSPSAGQLPRPRGSSEAPGGSPRDAVDDANNDDYGDNDTTMSQSMPSAVDQESMVVTPGGQDESQDADGDEPQGAADGEDDTAKTSSSLASFKATGAPSVKRWTACEEELLVREMR